MTRMVCLMTSLLIWPSGPLPEDVVPLLHAHAHNDYRHDRPLLDALDHGFTSVEADVFLVEDTLCVAHDSHEIKPERTLRSLYLDPLRRWAKGHGGRVYPDGPRFILFVDVKSAARPTYRRLHEILAGYRDLVTSFGPEGRKDRAVLVIVSGNRSLALMASPPVRYASYDGQLTDLGSETPADLMPLISDNWTRHFAWRGNGPMPGRERRTLKDIVRRAHAKGRLVRFWATPDGRSPAREALWRELLSAGVDLINTDDLQGLKVFLLKNGR
jgi:hypothetical protein